jgi:hypothetical protein
MTVLGWLWTLPLTLIYLPVVLTYGPRRCRLQDGLLRVDVGRIWIGYSSTIGQTVGSVIVIRDDYADLERIWVHERHHARAQFWRYGILFPIMYGLASLNAWAAGLHFYRDNVFEVAARKAEWQ